MLECKYLEINENKINRYQKKIENKIKTLW